MTGALEQFLRWQAATSFRGRVERFVAQQIDEFHTRRKAEHAGHPVCAIEGCYNRVSVVGMACAWCLTH